MAKRIDFVYSEKQEPHRLRTKKILQQHPEVRELIGKNKYTFFAILGLVLFQVALAWVLKDSSWWLVFGAAYLLGAFADHSLFVMIHECAHHLLFKSRAANRLAGILANLPQLFPSSISFERYHIKHHSFQGIHELDADLPNRWEARLINNYFIGKCLWLMFYPLFQIFRINRLREIKPFDGWVALNWGLEAIFVAAIWYFLGPKAIVYLLASFFFSVGLHPLGARWIQEHYLTDDEHQETHSYYGWLNILAFNSPSMWAITTNTTISLPFPGTSCRGSARPHRNITIRFIITLPGSRCFSVSFLIRRSVCITALSGRNGGR
jgi:sphingolipid 4-desaturase/C4-monooxygenase